MTEKAGKAIDDFMAAFEAQQDKYRRICAVAEQTLTELCSQKGIMAKVNGRVKDPGRLREKLIKRHEKEGKPYRTVEEIHSDITDLVGLRIALYFPGDKEKIQPMLSSHFVRARKPKEFPIEIEDRDRKLVPAGFSAYQRRIYPGYDRRFDGYCATHYKVHLAEPPTDLDPDPVIEIQVASLLMHSWSEVEHDLAYKNKMGEVSPEEYACLDEINGLVMAGELALNRLSQLSRQRIKKAQRFDTHYTLRAYLDQWQKERKQGEKDLGNVETLFQLYAEKDLLTQADVDGALEKLEKQRYGTEEPLADRLIEQFAADRNLTLVKKVVSSAVMKVNDLDPETYSQARLGQFMGKWNALERTVMAALRGLGHKAHNSAAIWHFVMEENALTPAIREEYHRLRLERNKIVHGYRAPAAEEFHQLNADIDRLAEMIRAKYTEGK